MRVGDIENEDEGRNFVVEILISDAFCCRLCYRPKWLLCWPWSVTSAAFMKLYSIACKYQGGEKKLV